MLHRRTIRKEKGVQYLGFIAWHLVKSISMVDLQGVLENKKQREEAEGKVPLKTPNLPHILSVQRDSN